MSRNCVNTPYTQVVLLHDDPPFHSTVASSEVPCSLNLAAPGRKGDFAFLGTFDVHNAVDDRWVLRIVAADDGNQLSFQSISRSLNITIGTSSRSKETTAASEPDGCREGR